MSSSSECALRLENFFTNWLDAYDNWFQDDLLHVIMNATDAFGELSFIFRECYKVGGSLQNNWSIYTHVWDSALSIFNMFKRNIVQNATDIDNRSWSAYNTAANGDWDDFVFDTSRLFYLFFL